MGKIASLTYRLVALALALSFALGTAMPAACHQEAASDAMSHPGAVPCAAPCHATKAPQNEYSALLAAARLPAPPDFFPVAPPTLDAERPPAHQRVASVVQARARPVSAPVRLHVYHAVFLN